MRSDEERFFEERNFEGYGRAAFCVEAICVIRLPIAGWGWDEGSG